MRSIAYIHHVIMYNTLLYFGQLVSSHKGTSALLFISRIAPIIIYGQLQLIRSSFFIYILKYKT